MTLQVNDTLEQCPLKKVKTQFIIHSIVTLLNDCETPSDVQ